MHKVLISNTEIDLSDKQLTITEENSWFADSFFSKYSYPFEISLTDEMNKELGDIRSFDSIYSLYSMDVQYVFYNKLENAKLNIEEIHEETNSASVSLQYGMDDFPNFDKNLKELNLLKKTVSNIYTHANVIIEQNYPQTNYNFPMIHTDKYDNTDPLYNGFENIINKRSGNIFVQNVVEGDEMLNKNIMQPMPYLMYILKQGFLLSGREVQGDIVTDPLLNSLLVFSEKEYFSRIDSSGFEMQISGEDLDQNTPFNENVGFTVVKTFTVTQPGYYNIIGDINLGILGFTIAIATFVIKINGVAVYHQWHGSYKRKTFLVDVFFDLQPGEAATITLETSTCFYENVFTADLQCLPVYFYNSDGTKMTNLINSNEIDLSRSVPDMTFGSFFNIIMNWFNYDVDEITEDKVVINKVNSSFQTNEVFDLSKFDNVRVKRKVEHDNSFLIKYNEDGEVDLGGVYIDKNKIENVTKEFDTEVKNTIEINAYVLQNETINGIRTAKSNKSSEDKLCVVIYDGPIYNENVCKEPTDLQINNIVNYYYSDWIYNRINTQSYILNFTTNIENIVDLNCKKRVYSHNNLHLCKSIQKTEISPDIFEVEIETERFVIK